jgi:hypothetical protein
MPFKYFMRKVVIILCLTIIACSSPQSKPVSQTDTISEEHDSETNFRKDFSLLYSNPISIDTSFDRKGKKYRALFRHFSTMDNALTIPAKYNFDTDTDFVTHSFESELILLSERDTLFKQQITKLTFDKLLDSTLRKYSTLLYPDFYIETDSIKIHYSISIPVTDIGIGATISFDQKGKFTIVE